ncbi:MAG: glycogen/starch synthase [Nanoarchaeota archaeon]
MNRLADYLFEASWEVCNKVGGIYTVITSKAANIQGYYKDNYYLIGPYFPKKAHGVFQEDIPPEKLKGVFKQLENEGISCHFGTWVVKGNPKVILLEFSKYIPNKNSIKTKLWDDYKIDSLYTEFYDFDEPVIWANAVGRLLEECRNSFQGKIVAQFHEWLSGAAILYLKSHKVSIGTIFTTHATALGRAIASSGQDIYGMLGNIDPEQEAQKLGVKPKHQLEAASAKNADVFTTVSEITGIEAEKLLGRKPDVLLPNGLDIHKFPTIDKLSIRHNLFKAKVFDFLIYYFFPHYPFDLDNTLVYFLAGRHEFRDKGIDMYINALALLNQKLKKEKSKRTIVAFFWVPGNIQGIKPEILENKRNYEDIADSISDEIKNIQHRLVHSLITKKKIDEFSIFDEELDEELKSKIMRFKSTEINPPLSTHNLYDENHDDILNGIKAVGLNNSADDKVKVVYYPIYLTGADGLLDTSYYESMTGSHLGVFPSYYEPWGYTPLESAGLGVPAITTDLAGYGRFIKSKLTGDCPGIYVISRFNKSYDESVKELAEKMYEFASLPDRQRVYCKTHARRTAEITDWGLLIGNYIKAHNLAAKKL